MRRPFAPIVLFLALGLIALVPSGTPRAEALDEISGICGFHNPDDADEFSWPAQAGAASYRVARSTDLQFGDDCLLKSSFATAWVSRPAPSEADHRK